MANNFELCIPATAMVLPSSAAPAWGNVQNRPYLSFDDTTVEGCRSVPFQMPAAYTGSGTLKADVHYIMASATTGTVNFEASVEAFTAADAVDLDAGESFDTANSGSATVPATAGHLGVMTITLTNKDSVAAGDYVRLKIERDADDAGSDDSATGDARLLQVVVREET
jgi:hypothetical protein